MNLSIIIVNYNTYSHLCNCLESIIQSIKNTDYEIIVVDNHSDEKLTENLIGKYEHVKLICLEKNIGFGAANNVAFKIARGKYLFLVNPDIILKENSIQYLVRYLEDNDDIGVVAPVLITPGGFYDYYYSFFPSMYSIIMRQVGLYNHTGLMKKRMVEFLDSKIAEGKPFPVQQVIGACFLTRKSIYDDIGGFDEVYFLYQEETDWELRMSEKEWKIMILPEAIAVHDHHASANKLGKIYVGYHGLRSIIIYSCKHFHFFKRLILRITMTIALFLRIIKFSFVYLLNPQSLKSSLYYLFKLLVFNFRTQGSILRSRYRFEK